MKLSLVRKPSQAITSRRARRGVAYIEFAFSLIVLIPLLLGVIGTGLNLHIQLQTVQLARDAGHMYARGIDFSLTGNQQVLAAIGSSLGLSTTAGSGNSVVILSTVTYIDASACTAGGYASTASCPNYQKWAFTQRIVVGNNTLRTSNIGTPPTAIINSSCSFAADCISYHNQAGNAADVATITGINPSATTTGALPSGQVIYISEASAKGFHMPPFASGTNTYACNYF